MNIIKCTICTFHFGTAFSGCTKLDETLNSTLTSEQAASSLGSTGTDLLLRAAYADLAGPFHSQDLIFSLQENTTDESLVPTRGGDWDDNGVWRVLHNHSWNANHGQILNVFNGLNRLNFDATNVLAFNPTATQAAQARFLRAMSLFYLLDLYGQYPFRNPGDNLLNPPVVKSGADGIQFIIDELNAALPNLPTFDAANRAVSMPLATADAARVLLMKCYLNRGAFINRAAPTFAAADMQQVITLGNTLMTSGRYSYVAEYFDQFEVNKGRNSTEGIFAYPSQSGVAVNNGGIAARWNMTLHYNSYTPNNPNAGWNGFSTVSDFYNAFGATTPTTYANSDTLIDKRIGRRYYAGATNVSGLRPGFLVGQQFNENGTAINDRKGNPLAYKPAIAANMIELGNDLEITGIRVVKYPPDYQNYGGPAGNWLMIFRYPDVVLMVAEARHRTSDVAGALVLVNQLRAVRGAAPLTTLPLVNVNNVDDPTTLLAERGRELYWESLRRTDLIRFGVFLKPFQLKPNTSDSKYLVFPIPSQALAANPNLVQNNGY